MRGVLPVPENFRTASARPEAEDKAAGYFRTEVMEDIHPHLKDAATERLLKLIHEDITILETRKESLTALSEGNDYGRFLSETFIYAMNRPCKPDSGDGNQKISIPLLIFLFLIGSYFFLWRRDI